MRRRLVSYIWDGGVQRENTLVRVTVLERCCLWFRWCEATYVGQFRSGIFTGEWEFWDADSGRDLDPESANRIGQMLVGASMYDRMTA